MQINDMCLLTCFFCLHEQLNLRQIMTRILSDLPCNESEIQLLYHSLQFWLAAVLMDLYSVTVTETIF